MSKNYLSNYFISQSISLDEFCNKKFKNQLLSSEEKASIRNILQFLKVSPNNLLLRSLNNSFIKIFENTFDNFENEKDLFLVGFGVDTSLQEFTPQEFREKIDINSNPLDFSRVVYTLKMNFLTKESRLFLPDLLTLLQKDEWLKKEEFSLEEVLLFDLALFTLWSEFTFLSYENQQFIIEKYFYHSFLVGIPVDKVLNDILYQSPDIEQYILYNGLFLKALEKNTETVLFGVQKRLFREVVNEFITVDNILDTKKIDIFISKNSSGKDKDFFSAMRASLDVVIKIKSGNLIQKFQFEEKTENFIYDEDVKKLIFCFINKIYWPNIKRYFKQKDPLVKLSAFLYQLSHHDTFDNEDVVQNYLEFTNYLKENNLLQPNQEIIEFNEDDGKFHSSDSFLKD